jgi:hypothetical protein
LTAPADIRWISGADAADTMLPCSLCGATGPQRRVLAVPSLAPPHAPLALLRFPIEDATAAESVERVG